MFEALGNGFSVAVFEAIFTTIRNATWIQRRHNSLALCELFGNWLVWELVGIGWFGVFLMLLSIVLGLVAPRSGGI